ncbi:LysR family transcriptional regulator [Pseudomonas kielensis]|jgi:DNA-binding transcriptional LysR family regulator|uniref:LysR family transcriptional regulator n=1 Tax=Pseudomonas TaxID=286 RepID=UPI00141223E7|nr:MULTISPECIES: LysR family transcriptional regulator [Pseudomonas]NBB34990.1 LysR family transcriptional regulator [Pseudomonas sp. BC115LW]UZM15731.1 LysR family transcriptional regulator [Pseudomonas kielensis]WKL52072.1 LysR family transcriptional regulator [Pseudomonas kielensis]
MTPRRLRQFLALIEHAHFGRAAKTLGISQPALSKSIQLLESELGVTLFDRRPEGVVLTAFGRLLHEKSHRMLMVEEDLRRDIALLAGGDIGALKVALGPYPSVTSGYASIARLHARHPQIRITAHVAGWREVAHQVASGTVDLGIAEISTLQGQEEFTCELLGEHEGRLFCRPGHPLLSQKRSPTLAQTLDYPWVASRIPLRLATHLLPATLGCAGAYDALTGDFVPAIEIDVPMQIVQFVESSNALALGNLSTFEPQIRAGEIVPLPTHDLALRTHYGFIYLKERSLPPAVEAYMREVRAVEEEICQRERVLAQMSNE